MKYIYNIKNLNNNLIYIMLLKVVLIIHAFTKLKKRNNHYIYNIKNS